MDRNIGKVQITVETNIDEIQDKVNLLSERLTEISNMIEELHSTELVLGFRKEMLVQHKAPEEEKEEKPVRKVRSDKGKKRGPKDIDHCRIVALYTAVPPRSVKWIADDLGCTTKTVINHLKRDGLYAGKREGEI